MSKPVRPHVYLTGALKRMYGQLKGESADLFADHGRIKTDMEHVGAVLRMFDTEIDLAAIKPIRPYKPARTRWARTALKILREANAPMRGRDLARRVMAERGIDPNDFRTMVSIECSMQAVLLRLARRGLVVTSGKPRRWAIARQVSQSRYLVRQRRLQRLDPARFSRWRAARNQQKKALTGGQPVDQLATICPHILGFWALRPQYVAVVRFGDCVKGLGPALVRTGPVRDGVHMQVAKQADC